jgi:polysaccharide pyruvyl transferase WcaK-like protein
MAMLGGTPAMGLGYEHKTEEIFNQLGFGEYQVGFEKGLDQWLECSDHFLKEISIIRTMLPKALDDISEKAQLNVEAVESCLEISKHAKTDIPFKCQSILVRLQKTLEQ